MVTITLHRWPETDMEIYAFLRMAREWCEERRETGVPIDSWHYLNGRRLNNPVECLPSWWRSEGRDWSSKPILSTTMPGTGI